MFPVDFPNTGSGWDTSTVAFFRAQVHCPVLPRGYWAWHWKPTDPRNSVSTLQLSKSNGEGGKANDAFWMGLWLGLPHYDEESGFLVKCGEYDAELRIYQWFFLMVYQLFWTQTWGSTGPQDWSFLTLGVSENSVPLNPMVNDHYPY